VIQTRRGHDSDNSVRVDGVRFDPLKIGLLTTVGFAILHSKKVGSVGSRPVASVNTHDVQASVVGIGLNAENTTTRPVVERGLVIQGNVGEKRSCFDPVLAVIVADV
jgi:hypothetical protein